MTTFGTILVLITFIIFFMLSIKFFKEMLGFCTIHHIFFSPIHAFLSIICTTIIFLVLGSIASGKFTQDISTKKEVSIYPIDMNLGKEPFHLGIGITKNNKETSTSIPTYNFYTKCNNKYCLEEVNAKNFKIVCTDSIKPKIVFDAIKEIAKLERLKFIFNENFHSSIDEKDLTGTIYIPKNSIIQPYTK